MKDMLAEIVAKKKDIVDRARLDLPLAKLKKQVNIGRFAMEDVFSKNKWSLIAKCKLQSPSKGNFGHPYSVADLARMYENSGAKMLSVHTDPHFLGRNEDIPMVKKLVNLPVLRKDFIIDEYQIYEASMLKADAVLLIARILTDTQLKEYYDVTRSLGLDALIEVHDQEDMEKALATPGQFIGINNRNLKLFKTTIQNTIDLLPYADRSRKLISESGIHTVEEAKLLHDAGLDGILVGEGLSTAPDVEKQTRAFAEL